MTRRIGIILFFISTLISLDLSSQSIELNKIKKKSFTVNACSVIIDSFTLAPKSVLIEVESDTITSFEIVNNRLVWTPSACARYKGKMATIHYRVLPFNIETSYFHLDSSMMKTENKAISIGSNYNQTIPNQDIINAKGLDYNGSFSRGFSVGNSQSLLLNSNFNLQLAGDLGNGLQVVAAISDDNIPIQPEGNTQLIQEFDRVFIKVSKDKTSVIAGDYILERPKSYFINVFKKLQGLSAKNEFQIDPEKRLTTEANFAVSRGKFARQFLETSEGNQGPYKLTGANGERFLIVLSGSEKVFLDGKLLQRGLEHDYIIDYNRAEITFTPSRLIGRETRIIVEYEYRVQNYLRSVYAANVYYDSPKYKVNFNFYNEQDSKTATGDIVLDSMDIGLLSGIGDDLTKARVSSIRLANDTAQFIGQVRYRLNPNVANGDPDAYFLEYSNDSNEALYVASFSEVGANMGRYVIDDQTNVNGRVYKYVGPEKGSYEPITRIIPPEKRQMISLGASARPTDGMQLSSELSLSNTDINRFSLLGNSDNIGIAGVLKYDHKVRVSQSKQWTLETHNYYEFVDKNFLPLNPYRSAEFIRDWNLPNPIIEGAQDIVQTSLSLVKKDSFLLSYSYQLFDIENAYRGVNQKAKFNYKYKGLKIDSKLDYLTTSGYGEETTFIRPLFDVSQLLMESTDLSVGLRYEVENNKRFSEGEFPALLSTSFAFDLLSVYIKNDENNRFHYRFQVNDRNDLFADPLSNQLTNSINTREFSSLVKWTINPRHSLNFNLGYRNFDVGQEELLPQAQSSKKTIIGKLEHNIQAFKGLILSNTNYIINSGQEPKIEYFFEKVEPGQGDYIYIGNEDSTLINANFRYAPDLGTGNYIRLSLINNEFITTNNQSLSQTLRLEPKRIWGKQDGKFANLIARFSTINTFRISKKIEEDGTAQSNQFLNFDSNVDNLVSYNSLISNTLFFNRGNPSYDIQVGNKVSEVIFTQISGLERRNVNEYFGRTRVKVLNSTDFLLNLKRGNKGYASELNTFRNLDIDYYSINPEISYRPSTNIRINTLYTFDSRKQNILQNESAKSHDFTINTTIRQATSSNINFSFSFVTVQFDGEQNSSIEFDLLEGLKNGENYLWNTTFTKRLSNSIDLNINYEGRKTGNAPTVHIARAQIKATF